MPNKNNASGCNATYNTCKWWQRHQWSKWIETKSTEIKCANKYTHEHEVIYIDHHMEKTCFGCGIINFKTVREYLN